jgi:cation diffusion facilitator CzcD-associated flavoprotein CzcO
MVSKMADYDQENITYTQFACIGTGFGGIGLGATLKRWYGITDVRFFERHGQLGGTWYISQYPGTYLLTILLAFSNSTTVD